MPVLKVRWNPFDQDDPGPCIKIIVMPTEDEMRLGAFGLEYPKPIAVKALLDTGAQSTIINRVLARSRKLALTATKVPVRTIGGSCFCDEHACSIAFPGSDLPRIGTTRILAGEFDREPYYSCLIGRDIIRNWSIQFDGRSGFVAIATETVSS